jgi:hypothetical protein
MDLDTMLAEAAPARRESLSGPDSPPAVSLYQRITAMQPGATAASRRRRRLVLPVTAATAALAAAATALMLVSGSPVAATRHSGGRQSVTLAAWSVIARPAGLVQVTIHQLRDPEGLESALRADGVPANVRFLPYQFQGGTGNEKMPSSCRAPRMSDEANAKLQAQIMPDVVPGKLVPGSFHIYPGGFGYMASDQSSGYVLYISHTPSGVPTISQLKFPGASPGAVVYIQPSAIPRGIGLYLAAWAAPGAASSDAPEGPAYQLQAGLIAASPQCTGS